MLSLPVRDEVLSKEAEKREVGKSENRLRMSVRQTPRKKVSDMPVESDGEHGVRSVSCLLFGGGERQYLHVLGLASSQLNITKLSISSETITADWTLLSLVFGHGSHKTLEHGSPLYDSSKCWRLLSLVN